MASPLSPTAWAHAPVLPLPFSPPPGAQERELSPQWLASRWCVRCAYRRLGGAPTLPLPGRTSRGIPLFPAGWSGSISHTRDRAMALVGDSSWALGCDIEQLGRAGSRLARRVATPDELTEVSRATGVDFSTAGLILFSAKEAAYKAVYPLLGVPNRFRDLSLTDCGPSSLVLTLGDDATRLEIGLTLSRSHLFACCRVPKNQLGCFESGNDTTR